MVWWVISAGVDGSGSFRVAASGSFGVDGSGSFGVDGPCSSWDGRRRIELGVFDVFACSLNKTLLIRQTQHDGTQLKNVSPTSLF